MNICPNLSYVIIQKSYRIKVIEILPCYVPKYHFAGITSADYNGSFACFGESLFEDNLEKNPF